MFVDVSGWVDWIDRHFLIPEEEKVTGLTYKDRRLILRQIQIYENNEWLIIAEIESLVSLQPCRIRYSAIFCSWPLNLTAFLDAEREANDSINEQKPHHQKYRSFGTIITFNTRYAPTTPFYILSLKLLQHVRTRTNFSTWPRLRLTNPLFQNPKNLFYFRWKLREKLAERDWKVSNFW